MHARASYSTDTFPDYELEDVLIRADEPEAFYAGEPISAPPRKRGNPVRKFYVFLFAVLGTGAGLIHFDAPWQQWVSNIEQVVSSAMSARQLSASLESAPPKDVAVAETSGALPPSPPPAANSQPLPEVVIAEAPGSETGSPSSETKSDAGASESSSTPSTPADPYRKRAEAVGLHPDLSHVLLSRLTATDYRNAAFAIDKALKTIPDDGVFEWPRSRKNGSAVFNIHFVAGAGHDCRRYVVTVTKDRWTTTALPMERCGVKLADRGAAKGQSIE
ncbi:hypothetical protein [Hyphomicrobium sp. 99]|uniref:hypothetical protein n=1 Tax=Hyphomicrobium sp. 99 TaxID=1163419 RepID=UPI00069738C0|nr:hypothetical protein [Hyphomicrobium sp. 99]